MNDENNPLEEVYNRGVAIEFGDVINGQIEELWNPEEDIDWNRQITVDEDIVRATSDAAMQFHYINMGFILLMGKILTRPRDFDQQKIALILAFSRMQETNVWGRYLGKTQTNVTVSPRVRTYFEHLFDEDDDITLLLGLEILGGVLIHRLLCQVEDVGDPIFQTITQKTIRQKEENIRLSKDYFANIIDGMDREEREAIADRLAWYNTYLVTLFQGFEDHFRTIGRDPEETMRSCGEAINSYYRSIGLPEASLTQ